MLAAGSLPLVDRYVGAELVGKSNLRIADLTRQPDIMPGASAPRSGSDARAMFARAPSALLRGLFSAPGWLYRARLGWLLGHRFMQLSHAADVRDGCIRPFSRSCVTIRAHKKVWSAPAGERVRTGIEISRRIRLSHLRQAVVFTGIPASVNWPTRRIIRSSRTMCGGCRESHDR
jgi:hypothetical protein